MKWHFKEIISSMLFVLEVNLYLFLYHLKYIDILFQINCLFFWRIIYWMIPSYCYPQIFDLCFHSCRRMYFHLLSSDFETTAVMPSHPLLLFECLYMNAVAHKIPPRKHYPVSAWTVFIAVMLWTCFLFVQPIR